MVGMRRIWSAAALAAWLVAAPAAAGAAAVPAQPASPVDARLAAAKAAMMGDPAGALTLSIQALALAKADAGPRRDQEIAAAQWLQGEALLRLDRPDEAAPVIAAGLAVAAAKAPEHQAARRPVMTQAALEAARGEVQSALRDFQAAYRIFGKAGHPRGQAVALQNIGSIYQDAHDYKKVLHYYAQSAEAYPADQLLQLSAANNIGNALMSDEQYGRAVTEFEKARKIARQMDSPQLEARIMANLAIAEAHNGHPEAAKGLIDAANALLAPLADAQDRPALGDEGGGPGGVGARPSQGRRPGAGPAVRRRRPDNHRPRLRRPAFGRLQGLQAAGRDPAGPGAPGGVQAAGRPGPGPGGLDQRRPDGRPVRLRQPGLAHRPVEGRPAGARHQAGAVAQPGRHPAAGGACLLVAALLATRSWACAAAATWPAPPTAPAPGQPGCWKRPCGPAPSSWPTPATRCAPR
jgi:tetratricopeptide (TPR) repeat protein